VLSACASSAEHFVPSFTRFLHPSKGGENRPIEIAAKVAMRKLAWLRFVFLFTTSAAFLIPLSAQSF
jgi:hypothetical protein